MGVKDLKGEKGEKMNPIIINALLEESDAQLNIQKKNCKYWKAISAFGSPAAELTHEVFKN